MRKKIVIATTAGVLGLSGLAFAVPALAAPGSDGGAPAAVERITEALSGLVTDASITQEQADEVATTLSEAGVGRGGHHGGGGVALEAAATALGMTEAGLRTALEPDGATLAQVAEDQGVPVDELVAALVQAQEERIAQAVEDGRLTQEEADERLADVEERVTERVNSEAPARGHGPRGHDGD
ncbi:hypothetical protein GCU60_13410 [Blastococcus saxobsidens]|uniref:Uncharacterized protein n=1 Tax=Blastococcus saxobsidens TaxID=138336 RepID=A0A6L9W411_9ACTN|nr:hypothetical protein [Blastococcus saxobsidens]NEK86743.1 hypothetical protein [Blastococcus saxobsidens]